MKDYLIIIHHRGKEGNIWTTYAFSRNCEAQAEEAARKEFAKTHGEEIIDIVTLEAAQVYQFMNAKNINVSG